MTPYEKLAEFSARLRGLMACDSAIEEHFDRLAFELFSLQFESNDVYRRFCEARGITPEKVPSWEATPALPTRAFKEFDVASIPTAQRTEVFHSSGTTGHTPGRHWHSPESLLLYEDSLWTWFRKHLVPEGTGTVQMISLTPGKAGAPNSSLVHMFDAVRRRLGAGLDVFAGTASGDKGWNVNTAAFSERVSQAAALGQPVLLLGTAFSLVQLLDWVDEHRLKMDFPPDSRVMETGGYKGRSRTMPRQALYQLIATQLGVQPANIISEYGMSELSSQAYDAGFDGTRGGQAEHRVRYVQAQGLRPRAFQFPPWARVRLLSPESGQEVAENETGLIQVFDLANVFSVMAVQTEDLGIRQGAGFTLASRAESAEVRGCSLMSVG